MGNKETEEKYNGIKENAQIVDDIRDDIKQLENKKRSTKMTVSMSHKKTGEMDTLLKNTFEPLKGYMGESTKIAGRVKAAQKKKADYAKLKEEINLAVLKTLEEVRFWLILA